MPELDNRPELPEIFPQDEVVVDGEEHTFKVSKLDNSTQAQLEYTLDKAPVEEIEYVQGVDEQGNSRSFSNGVDYELTSKTETVISDFEFDESEEKYLLRYEVDAGTDAVSGESSGSFTKGTDYDILDSHNHSGDTFVWLDDGSTPEKQEQFTIQYEVTSPSSLLEWQADGENLPKANSRFFVTYRAESIISRYLDAHEQELDNVDDAIQEAINSKFIDTASGDSLDEIGKLFGQTIGKRRGRSDTQYRIYLKSVVQSFISRGTVNGIKLAVSAATDIPLENVTINEDFENNEYEVEVIPTTSIPENIIEEVADIADPSGVSQSITRFAIPKDNTGIDETTFFTEGQQISDDTDVSGTTAVDDNTFSAADEAGIIGTILIDPNFTLVSDTTSLSDVAVTNRAEANDTLATDDAFAIDPNKKPATDDVKIQEGLDIEAVKKNAHRWEKTNDPNVETRWSFSEWTIPSVLERLLSDISFIDDSTNIPPKSAEVSESFLSDDDTSFRFADGSTADTSGFSDSLTISVAPVLWESNDWGSFKWA